jgi:hypothetical protein
MRVGLICCVTLTLGSAALGQSAILDLGTERAQRVVVTVGETAPELDGKNGSLESEMTRALKGVIADLQGKAVPDLRSCVPPSPFLGDPSNGELVCVLHLSAGTHGKRVDVVRVPDGNFVAMEAEGSGETGRGSKRARAELRRDQFAAMLASWPAYRGGFDAGTLHEPRGEVFTLEKPYTPGRFLMDEKTLGDRFLNGGKTNVAGADRVLDQEKLFCRLPKDYDPRTPAGLLVWIDAGSSGQPPRPMWEALDALNLICVGAGDAGNNRLVSNREQLALDGVATVTRRYHVDARRIYVSGVSGGGRVSSMMLACFPDVFTGAVPIVGLSCYDAVPSGTGGWWPRAYLQPKAEMFRLFKTRPMAGMTGQKDFNQIEMEHASDIMRKDGVQVKLFEYPDMGHELPRPERFKEAIEWVDRVWKAKRGEEEVAAKKAWEAYTAKYGERKAEDEGGRRMLMHVTEVGPWTEEAWKAVGVMGRK